MNQPYFERRPGFVLLDALIAVIVVGIGLLGVAKLNSVMLASTGLAKTRAEATQLAEGKLEEIRAQQPPAAKPTSRLPPDCEHDPDDPECITGINAKFARSWTIISSTDPTKDWTIFNPSGDDLDLDEIVVCVSWGDSCGGTGEKKVELYGLVTWTDLSTLAAVGSGENPGPSVGHPVSPAGLAREGGDNTYTAGSPPQGAITNANDGTSIYKGTGKTELIETATGKVLLTIDDGSDFSSITGLVYITWGSAVNKKDESEITLSVVNESIRVLGSAGSTCRQFVSGGGTTLPRYPASGTTKFSYFSYTCYMGAGWYGNVAIVRFDGGDRVCLGDPEVASTDVSPTSRRPLLSALRNYRGYTAACTTSPTSSACKSIGIGMGTGTYHSVNLGGISWSYFLQHDFLLTTIKGQPSNQDCTEEEAKPALLSSPFTFTLYPPHLGNTGLLYCLSATCPIASGFVTFQTNFSMTLTTLTPAVSPLAVDIDGGHCSIPTQTASPFVYNCQIDWIGWSGDYWTGNVSFSNADGTPISGNLSNVVLGGITPTTGIVTLADPVVGCTGSCVQFTKVSKDVTSFSFSLNGP